MNRGRFSFIQGKRDQNRLFRTCATIISAPSRTGSWDILHHGESQSYIYAAIMTLLHTILLIGIPSLAAAFSAPGDACNTFFKAHPNATFFPPEPDYITANTAYFTSSAWLGPACVFEPATSEQLSYAVQTLAQLDTLFAFSGGGHMPIPGYNNINSTGVLIASTNLNQLQISDDHSTVHVGPGNRWSDVYQYLEPYNRSAVGGRIGHVGVPGYILGGGVSFFSNEYGWASANVASFTVRPVGRVSIWAEEVLLFGC
jgi:hypothetical protein